MSRIGKQVIDLPSGVNVSVTDDLISADGPKGSLKQKTMDGIKLNITDGKIQISRSSNERLQRAQHGLMRALVQNMVVGVNKGFERKLELNGVGYRVSLQGQELKFSLGFSHEITYKLPDGVQAAIDQNIITISGIDKQQVGQVAAEIRALKKPEPYKGKGIKYVDEQIIRKSGKSGKEAAA